MSVTVDANVLVYASNSSDPAHQQARELVEELAQGPQLVYLFWPTILGYLRIITHPAILPQPLAPRDAVENIEQLLTRPHVQAVGEAEGFWELYQMAAGHHARGNDVPDAHLAALMLQHGVRIIYTRDRDFHRFKGIEPHDPFAG